MARGSANTSRMQEMANQRDMMTQKLIDALNANTQASGGAGGGGGGGSGGGGGGGTGAGRAKKEKYGPDAGAFKEAQERREEYHAFVESERDRIAKMPNPTFAQSSAGGLAMAVGQGLLAASPALAAQALQGTTAPIFAGLDARKVDYMDSERDAARRAGTAFKLEESEQRYNAAKTRYSYGTLHGDQDEMREGAADMRSEIRVQRAIRQGEESAIGAEGMARADVAGRLDAAARAGAFRKEGKDYAKNMKFVQDLLNFEASRDRDVVEFRQTLRNMNSQKDRSSLRNK